jgi:hypothetical protein
VPDGDIEIEPEPHPACVRRHAGKLRLRPELQPHVETEPLGASGREAGDLLRLAITECGGPAAPERPPDLGQRLVDGEAAQRRAAFGDEPLEGGILGRRRERRLERPPPRREGGIVVHEIAIGRLFPRNGEMPGVEAAAM